MSSVRLGTTTTVWGARGLEITRRASGPSFACKPAKRPSSSAEPGSGTSTGVDGVEIMLSLLLPGRKLYASLPCLAEALRRCEFLAQSLGTTACDACHLYAATSLAFSSAMEMLATAPESKAR